METQELLYVVEIAMEAHQLSAVEELLAALDLSWASWRNPESVQCMARVYADSEDAAGEACKLIRTLLHENMPFLELTDADVSVVTLKKEDWATVWKQYFHTFRASTRLVVKPSWERFAASPGDIVLDLDPGMSFGTGLHGTTRACLEFLDDLAQNLGEVSLLDAGCGSGILAMAAAKLGFSPVAAFDNDPQAVTIANENLQRAGVTGVDVFCADLQTVSLQPGFRVVVANILAPVLLDNAERLIGFLAAGQGDTHLILSGILTCQYESILAKFQGLGMCEEKRRTINEWTSGCFAK